MPAKCKQCPRWFGTGRGKNVHEALVHGKKHRKLKTAKAVLPQQEDVYGDVTVQNALAEYIGRASLRVSMLDGSSVMHIPVTVQLEFGS